MCVHMSACVCKRACVYVCTCVVCASCVRMYVLCVCNCISVYVCVYTCVSMRNVCKHVVCDTVSLFLRTVAHTHACMHMNMYTCILYIP